MIPNFVTICFNAAAVIKPSPSLSITLKVARNSFSVSAFCENIHLRIYLFRKYEWLFVSKIDLVINFENTVHFRYLVINFENFSFRVIYFENNFLRKVFISLLISKNKLRYFQKKLLVSKSWLVICFENLFGYLFRKHFLIAMLRSHIVLTYISRMWKNIDRTHLTQD